MTVRAPEPHRLGLADLPRFVRGDLRGTIRSPLPPGVVLQRIRQQRSGPFGLAARVELDWSFVVRPGRYEGRFAPMLASSRRPAPACFDGQVAADPAGSMVRGHLMVDPGFIEVMRRAVVVFYALAGAALAFLRAPLAAWATVLAVLSALTFVMVLASILLTAVNAGILLSRVEGLAQGRFEVGAWPDLALPPTPPDLGPVVLDDRPVAEARPPTPPIAPRLPPPPGAPPPPAGWPTSWHPHGGFGDPGPHPLPPSTEDDDR